MSKVSTNRIHERLADQRVLITGSTGFLAKAFVEKLLRGADSIGRLYLLVRPKADGTPVEDRIWREVLSNRAFDRLRALWGERFHPRCREKICVVAGDLMQERLGLSREAYALLTEQLTLIVNSAATVTFDEQIDEAIELNALGPTRLLQLAKDCGDIPFLHVSTCYVCGVRSGVVVEDFSAPEAARESLPRINQTGDYDLDGLLASMVEEARRIIEQHGEQTEAGRKALIDAGMRRARAYGWNDTYTLTKWIGEQLLLRDRGAVPLVVFRPAIIEGSFDEPMPGWIDGLRMADPIIIAYGRGKVQSFPGRPEIVIDLIPVDVVANAMVAALPVGQGRRSDVVVYQCGSSERNPLKLGALVSSIEAAFRERPMSDESGRPIAVPPLRLVDTDTFLNHLKRYRGKLLRTQRMLRLVSAKGRRARRLSILLRQIEQIEYFAKIYSPYTNLNCRFTDDGLRALWQQLDEADQAVFPFLVDAIDWEDYLIHRHIPGLRSYALGGGGEPTVRIRALAADVGDERAKGWGRGKGESGADPGSEAISQANDLFEMFRCAAQRWSDKTAIQIQREGRWIRYTYAQALDATGTLMYRFSERGLRPGDCVAICAENGPEWGLVYLALMRAGLTTVPLDPQLPAESAWSCAKFAGARLMCADPATYDRLCNHDEHNRRDVVLLREPFIPPPGASRDIHPEPAKVDACSVASILFTSGTTVDPKAVPLTHRNLLANAQALKQVHPTIGVTDEFLSLLPIYHAFEFTGGFLVPLASGATITYVEHLKGPEILAAMQATGTTIMLVVPRLIRSFVDAIEQKAASSGKITETMFSLLELCSKATRGRFAHRLFKKIHQRFGGRLRMVVCGGSRLEPSLLQRFERFGFTVYEGYGMTETSPVLTVALPGQNKPGSVGPPLPNIDLEIRNKNLEGIGEIWVKGPSVMSGYLNSPDATQEVLVDGWLRTGDLGRQDEDGFVFITGRSKDLIVTGSGKNVYPDEVEALYGDLPHVKELCVFGMPALDGLGDSVHAVVVLGMDEASGLDRSSIEREVRQATEGIGLSIPTHQRISTIHFWDHDLPKTTTLKAKRSVIQEMIQRGTKPQSVTRDDNGDEQRSTNGLTKVKSPIAEETTKATSAPKEAADGLSGTQASPALSVIREILAAASKRPERSINPPMHLLLDLGIDSIGKIDVISAVETRFGLEVDDETAAKITRVGDLLAVAGDRQPVGTSQRNLRIRQRILRYRDHDGVEPLNGMVSKGFIPVRWLVRGLGGAFMHTYIRVQASGVEHLPTSGAFILTPNHSSHLDAPAVVAAIGGRRRVWVAAAEDYFFNRRIRRFLVGKIFDAIPFDRHADGIEGLRRCGRALSCGDGLLIFPEGTRSLTGRMQPFRMGPAVLAIEHGVWVIPVYINHSFALMRKGKAFPKPGYISVTFGKPLEPPQYDALVDPYELFKAFTAQIEVAVKVLGRGVVEA